MSTFCLQFKMTPSLSKLSAATVVPCACTFKNVVSSQLQACLSNPAAHASNPAAHAAAGDRQGLQLQQSQLGTACCSACGCLKTQVALCHTHDLSYRGVTDKQHYTLHADKCMYMLRRTAAADIMLSSIVFSMPSFDKCVIVIAAQATERQKLSSVHANMGEPDKALSL